MPLVFIATPTHSDLMITLYPLLYTSSTHIHTYLGTSQDLHSLHFLIIEKVVEHIYLGVRVQHLHFHWLDNETRVVLVCVVVAGQLPVVFGWLHGTCNEQ